MVTASDERVMPENHPNFDKVLTLPNFLSISRLVLLPLILFFIANQQTIPALVFMFASWLTDALDGYIARKTNQVSNLGKILDHFVDKIWVGTILVTLVLIKNFPIWLAGMVIFRDILIVFGAAFVLQKRKIILSSNILGKITGFFFAVIMVGYLLPDTIFGIKPKLQTALIYLVALLIIATFINYLAVFIKTIRASNRTNQEPL
ncbi:MAG: CDP-alcohol phosphatidyltransferase family protein [candidate division WOR-3 bacterium]|nr:CDP-alcohol phosphatidyltransferase family protein [candidate division WOR-3 bacterium]